MKKLIKTLLTLALAAGMLMSLGVTAYADSAELPTVSVGYGYGCPDAAAVDMHGAAAEALTLDGIAIELRCEDGTAYIRVTDLAAVKLLRESTAKISELGIDLSKLYIKDGLILVKEDGMTADEVAALEAKISELTRTATIKLSVGDKFALGSGGVAAVYVEIGGFNAPPAQQAEEEEDAPAEEPTPKRQLKVEADLITTPSSSSPKVNHLSSSPEVTTLYVTYNYNFYPTSYDAYAKDTSTEEENDYAVVKSRCDTSYIYLVKSENDTAKYYYSTDNTNYNELVPGEIYEILAKKIESSDAFSRNEINDVVNNTEISISSSASKDDEIVHIQYNNTTPKTFNPDDENSGYEYANKGNKYGKQYKLKEKNDCLTITSAEEGKTVDEAHNLTANIKNNIYTFYNETTNGPYEEKTDGGNTPGAQSLTDESTPMITSLTVESTPGGEGAPNPVVIDTDGGGNPASQESIETEVTNETE